ncbi:FG-GAP-like repeat-containing protein [Streptomyces sp. NPDC020983]|uniref:FG-GAP-like repeat-containing protein n=1 Tax=Streptomyces sp. NPDC020983 TaxID=3365106 RepID=UPI0037A6609F
MTPHRHPASRAALAACITLILGASAVTSAPALAASGSPAAPTELAVIPPHDPDVPAADHVVVAGTTGFLHQRQGVEGYQWTDDATGTSHPVPALAGVPLANVVPAGGDAFAVTDTAGVLKVGTPDRDTLTSYPLPAGFSLVGVGVGGTRALIGRPYTTTGRSQVEVLDLAADGGTTVVPVTGLPDGAVLSAPASTATTDHAEHGVIRYQQEAGGPLQYSLVDLGTGEATDIPGPDVPAQVLLTPSDIAWRQTVEGTVVVDMLPVSAVLDGSASSASLAEVTVTPYAPYAFVPVGGHLLTQRTQAFPSDPAGTLLPLVDNPFDGGPATTLLGSGTGAPVAASDGSVVAVGGKDATVSAVHRFTPAADGTLTDTTVLPLPPAPSANAGLAVAHGFLRHVEALPQAGTDPVLRLYSHALAADSDTSGNPPFSTSTLTLPADTQMCEEGRICVRTVDGNMYGPSYLAGTTLHAGTWSVGTPLPIDRIVDASLHYQLVDSGTTQYVVDSSGLTVTGGPITGAALWNDTFWQAPASEPVGTVTVTSLTAQPNPRVIRSVATFAPCRATELQVAQHWLYWSCGTSGPAGVYDLNSGARIPVPAGQALLGDGYLVTHDAATHQLTMTDFHTGTAAAPLKLADVPDSPLADDRGITFAVDRYSDAVAYVTADRNVHVLATGVPASAPTATSTPSSDGVYPRDPGLPGWGESIALSRPVVSWQVTVTNGATGATAARFTGGPSRELLAFTWDGKLPDGRMAPSGRYAWRLDVTVPGGTSPVFATGGIVTVACGTAIYRGYNCWNQQSVLALFPGDGSMHLGHWYSATVDGRLVMWGSGGDWDLGGNTWQVNAVVPFGDFNGDGFNDMLVRDGSGALTAVLGDGWSGLSPDDSTVKHVRVGSGWNTYNLMQSVSDLNKDGHDDLIARDTSGVLWFYAGTGKSSFAPRVKIGPGWQSYPRIVAVADVTGDTVGDVVAVDASGAMWRYDGRGNGTLRPRVRTGTGWQAYNALIGIGDLNHDGRNDLVARDAKGVLWRYDGRGNGTFRPRVQIGVGWSSLRLY